MKNAITFIFAALLGVVGLSAFTTTAVAEESAPAPAEEEQGWFGTKASDWYVKPEAGIVKFSDYCARERAIALEVGNVLRSCKDSGFTVGYTTGYWFNEYLAGEIGLMFSRGFDVSGGGGSGRDAFTIDGVSNLLYGLIGVRGKYPIGEYFYLTGRGGINLWIFEGTGDVENSPMPGEIFISDNGVDPYYGLGVRFDFNEKIGILAEYTRYSIDGDNADSITGSFIWHF